MSEPKTKVTKASVAKFLGAVPDKERRADAKRLLKLVKDVTGEKPKMWGSSIVGFGSYHYKSTRSTQEGDWPQTGFSPRKQNLAVYIMPGLKRYKDLLKKLGPHKTGVSCLYLKRLADVDEKVLKRLIKKSVADMKKMYG